MASVIDLLIESTQVLWCWYTPQLMEIVNFPQYSQVGARGDCPHCSCRSLFQPVGGGGYQELRPGNYYHLVSSAQCQACKRFVLVIGTRHQSAGNAPYVLEAVYPLGKPNDSVAAEVPRLIAEDFSEALRCEWVKSYKAAVTMCRRALQASCVDLKAKDGKLQEQIDDLAEKRVITTALQETAHEIRSVGNDGAHPGKDGLNDVTEKDARDIIEFTRHFFHHVFVVPAMLKARQAPRPAAATSGQ
jgi:Domain of unknown function (DUF4145)